MIKQFTISFLLLALVVPAVAQRNPLRNFSGGQMGNMGNSFRGGSGGGKDSSSFKKRTGLEDSITINFRYLDSSRYQTFDSSVLDFTKRFPIPANYIHLGNLGNATKPLLFSPILKPGWDAGFHAYDLYFFKPEDSRFYNTTRPYSELGYLIGSNAEQMVHALHTQNINRNWNLSAQFRLINSNGFFKNQNTVHNNYNINSFYQSPNRRYRMFVVLINNKISSADNGGIVNDADLDRVGYKTNRQGIPTNLGPTNPGAINPFSGAIKTGTQYRNKSFLVRQQYDIGQKDSIVKDTVVIRLFYPRLRIEHMLQSNSYSYAFDDGEVSPFTDTGFYRKHYNFLSTPSTYYVNDSWNELSNDLSLWQFPDSKNVNQFIKVGATLQQLRGNFDGGSANYTNTWLHAEYRNKTRNRKWDMQLNGQLYLTGLNGGDYNAYASLKRLLSQKIGYLEAGFQNVNRTPSFIFNPLSSFNFSNSSGFNKENTVRIFGLLDQPAFNFKLRADYFLVTNYTYLKEFYKAAQQASPFNLLQVTAEKRFRLRKQLFWHATVSMQQTTGNPPVNVPLIFTRNQIGYEGSLGFKNLRMATGIEIVYHSAYKADGYSPLQGQFFYQDTETLRLKLPTINAYMHFRIRSFVAYVRSENLNTARTLGGFGFTNNNFAIPGYPLPGMQIRVGIFWSFVN